MINNETIMDEMSKYMVEHGEYVICNVNYRLLPSNNNTTTMNQIVEDVFGGVLWIKDNISNYKVILLSSQFQGIVPVGTLPL